MINNENKKMIKEINKGLRKNIGCEIFELEFDYRKKDIKIKMVKDTGILTKDGNRKFVPIQEIYVFDIANENEPITNAEIYLYLAGMLEIINMIITFTKQIQMKMLGKSGGKNKKEKVH
ncbi:MAG: hypothetical protein U9O94_10720 [Nanoarchaeota archaeon]|nr:hypothetical protein [Nanoarchaeota archaeon]